jgi:hypothetical protein
VSDGGVDVRAVLAGGPDGSDEIRVTFTPQRPGFHLYSLDLRPEQVRGLGTPTRVAVRSGAEAAGPAHADRPVQQLVYDVLGVALPVYPDGPVTVTLPVRRFGDAGVDVAVSFGACSEATCLPPVLDRVVALRP